MFTSRVFLKSIPTSQHHNIMNKILLSLLMILSGVFICDAQTRYTYSEIDGIRYRIIVVRLDGSWQPKNAEVYPPEADTVRYSGNITIPATVSYNNLDCPVTAVASGAFRDCDKILSVSLPECITSIGENAFSGTTLNSDFYWPDSLQSIGNYAFEGQSDISSITFPNKLNKIGSGAFANCSALHTVVLPESLTDIPDQCFSNCTSLAEVHLRKIIKIGNSAFEGCVSLTSVDLPETLEQIYNFAFFRCRNLTQCNIPAAVQSLAPTAYAGSGIQSYTVDPRNPMYTSVSGALFNKAGNKLLSYPSGLETYTLNQVDTIDTYAFYESKITTLTLPEGLKTINKYALYACPALQQIGLPASLDSIADLAIVQCQAIKNFSVAEGSKNFTTIDGVLFNYDQSALIAYPNGNGLTMYDIPAGVTSFSFLGNRTLCQITLPNSIETIPSEAFSQCENLQYVHIPETVHTLGNSVFANCPSLRDIVIPASVQNIGIGIFAFSSLHTLILKMTMDDYSWMNHVVNTLGEISPAVPDECVIYAHESQFDMIRQYFKGDLRPLDQWSAITAPENAALEAPLRWYDLHGRQVAHPIAGRIYIGVNPDGSTIKVRM